MARPLRGRGAAGGLTMDRIHWAVVPVLFAVGWLSLGVATLVTIDDLPTDLSAGPVGRPTVRSETIAICVDPSAQAFDDVEVADVSVVHVNVRPAVRRDQDDVDLAAGAGGIAGLERAPRSTGPRVEVEQEHFDRPTGAMAGTWQDVECLPVGRPL